MAGAGYKLFNTGDVLTAQQVNEYLQQQTVMVFADASARTTALSGVLAEGMLSYLKDTNKVYVYDGSAWLDVSSEIPSQTGNSGKYLTTDGTNASWGTISAGGMTLLSTTTLANSATTISSISQDYTHLYVIAYGVQTSSQNFRLYIAINGGASTDNAGVQTTGATTGAAYAYTGDYLRPHAGSSYLLYTNAQNAFSFTIYNYASTAIRKPISVNSGFYWDAIPDRAAYSGGAFYNSTSAVSSLDFNTTASTFSAGTVLVYGVK